MAVTIERSGLFVTLSNIDTDITAEDIWPEQYAAGIPIHSIDFVPAVAGDLCVIREGSLTGPIIFKKDLVAATYQDGGLIKPFMGQPIRPCINVSDGSYNAFALVIIQLGST